MQKAVAVAPGRQGRATRPEVPARRAIRGAKRQEAQDATPPPRQVSASSARSVD